MKHPFIALMTDFGEDDFFVASLKAVILSINPLARIIDITHQVRSFDIRSASFLLFSCYRFFPAKTIFLVIVDPGVGSTRKILLLETINYFFIAPDNGVLGFVLDKEKILHLKEVTNTRYILSKPSKTFEGRDKMAPVAAWLSKGIPIREFGPDLTQFGKLEISKPRMKGKEVIGSILYIDKFGNVITNIPSEMINSLRGEKSKQNLILVAGKKRITSYRETYSQGKKGELFFLAGSTGLIEIASRETFASRKIKAKTGDEVRILMKSNT